MNLAFVVVVVVVLFFSFLFMLLTFYFIFIFYVFLWGGSGGREMEGRSLLEGFVIFGGSFRLKVVSCNKIKDENGRLAQREDEVRKIWKEYFKDLYI